MTKERKKNPVFKHDKIPKEVPFELTLEKAKPTATGTTEFGTWELWPVKVNNATVLMPDKSLVAGYSGEAIWFPTEKMCETLHKITGDTKEKCVITITRSLEENENGDPFKNYEIVAVTNKDGETTGVSPPNSLSTAQLNFIKDFKGFVDKQIIESSKEIFVKFGQSPPNNFDNATIDKLWAVYNE